MFRYTKREKLIIATYQKSRETLGVRASIAKVAAELSADKTEVCKVLGFNPIKWLTE